MKAIEQYFPVVLFIMLYKVVLTFESADEILKCDHSSESYWAVLTCAAGFYSVQEGSNFWICNLNENLEVWPFKWTSLSSICLWCSLLLTDKVVDFWVCEWHPSVTIQMKATERYFPVVLFSMLHKVAQAFVSVNELGVSIIIRAKTLWVETSVVKFRNNPLHILSMFCSQQMNVTMRALFRILVHIMQYWSVYLAVLI